MSPQKHLSVKQILFPVSVVLLFLLIVLQQSCKKTDFGAVENEKSNVNKTEQFFRMPPTVNSALKRVVEELKKQNNSKEFIEEFIAKQGFAIWNKASIFVKADNTSSNNFPTPSFGDLSDFSDTTIYIPLVLDNAKQVNAFIKATVTDTVSMRLFKNSDYKNFPFQTSTPLTVTTAENYALRMMQMDRDVFGNTRFDIKDKRLFNNSIDYRDTGIIVRVVEFGNATGNPIANGFTMNTALQTLCVTTTTTTVTPTPGSCTCGISNPASNCTCSCSDCVNTSTTYSIQCETWFEDGVVGTGWPVYSGDGGGVGGVGGGNPPPCSVMGPIVSTNNPVAGCPPVPSVWPPAPTQEQLDFQWMEDKVKDSTVDPCVANALATLKNISPKFPELVRNFFSEVPNFKMTLKKYTNSNWVEPPVGTPIPPEGAFTTTNLSSNLFNVAINKYYKDCTDLGLAATIIHEALHCQLMNWYRLAYFSPDSTSIRISLATNYGYLFPPIPINAGTDSILGNIIKNIDPNSVQHQDMITRYQTQVANALYQFAISKNINVTLDYCKDLAWSGCFDSKAYKDLSATNRNRINNRCSAEKDPYSSLTFIDSNGNEYGVNYNNYPEKGHPCH